MRRFKPEAATVRAPTGIFSPKLASELQSILASEFDQKISNDATLQEIGLRLVEFVAIKERSKIAKQQKL